MIIVAVGEKILQTTISLKLEKAGYQVASTGDGLEVLELIETANVNLIISNIMLPSASGYEISVAAKATENKIPVIILTPMRQKESMLKALETGVDYYISIPFRMTELLEKVKLLMPAE